MQIQSQALLDKLIPGTYELRDETKDRKMLNSAISYAEAVSKCIQGQIEGIAAPSGRIKYLRMLPVEQRPKVEVSSESADESDSTAFARLKMGVYREAVCGPEDEFGNAPVIGYVLQLHRQPASARHAQ